MKNSKNRNLHPSPGDSSGNADWFGTAAVRFDSVEAQSPNLNKLEGIRERIRQGFYTQKQVDNDVSDKLARAFFDIDLE